MPEIRKLYPNLVWIMVYVTMFIACYWPTFKWMNFKFSLPESYYSHGYLIPLVSIYIAWQKKDLLVNAGVASGSIGGLALILVALSVHIFGVLGDINFISGFSMVVYLIGSCLFLMGKAVTRLLIFPLFFLVFMCPIPDGLISHIALPMKSLATDLSLWIIALFNIPYMREGFQIFFPDSVFFVGTPCNGMRSLISFLALGMLFLYFIRTSIWKMIVITGLIPVMSVILNGTRIALLLLIAYLWGQDAASPESFLHDASGMLVFFVGLLVLGVVSIHASKNENT